MTGQAWLFLCKKCLCSFGTATGVNTAQPLLRLKRSPPAAVAFVMCMVGLASALFGLVVCTSTPYPPSNCRGTCAPVMYWLLSSGQAVHCVAPRAILFPDSFLIKFASERSSGHRSPGRLACSFSALGDA